MKSPVIFLVFNRPDVTRQVLQRIREYRPEKLYIVCDGPRDHRPDDKIQVEAVKKVIEELVDWPCEVERDYAPSNLGCRNRVASGLSGGFAKYDRAIVLEDDCLPEPSFFAYCDELLERYANDQDVMHISGHNVVPERKAGPASYYFSAYPAIWGWASWSRAWKSYAGALPAWPQTKNSLEFHNRFLSEVERQRRFRNWDGLYAGKIDTWDYQWSLAVISNRGLAISPRHSLITNLGIGHPSATHTTALAEADSVPSTKPMAFPLIHPAKVRNEKADQALEEINCPKPPLVRRVINRLRRAI